MKRSTFDGQTIVYRYGVPTRWGGKPVDLPEEAFRQLRQANDLRNSLVEAERAHEDEVVAIWATDPACAAAQQAVVAAEQAVAEVERRAKTERSKDRTTIARDATAADLAITRDALTATRKTLKAAQQAAYPALKADFAAARARVNALTAAGGPMSCANTDLHAATYSDVVDGHKVAVAELGRRKAAGRWGQMRFHRWDGSGTLRAQLQRQAGDPVRSPVLLAAGGGKWANVASFTPLAPHTDRVVPDPVHGTKVLSGRDRMRMLRMTLGRGQHMELPVVMHRPLPDGADVTDVRVTRRRVAGGYRLSVQVTCRLDDVPCKPAGHVAGVNIGWRSFGADGVRVAVVLATRLPAPPAHLAGVVRLSDDRRVAEVFMPRRWSEALARTAGLRAVRDKALDTLRAQLVAVLPVDGVDVTAAEVARWKSPARFVRLSRTWPAGHDFAARLEAWRLQDRHLWEWEAHERDQVVARRRGAWREVAAWLTGNVTTVAVETTSLPDLAEVPDVGDEDDRQARLARAQRQLAAPGELRQAIRQAARRRGTSVEETDPKRVSVVHAACGASISRAALTDQATVACPGCGHTFDQDFNAAANLLARALTMRPPPGTARTQVNNCAGTASR